MIRIQRKRTRGWKMPKSAIYVGRPSKWGNPFKVGYLIKIGKGGNTGGFCWLRCLEEKYNDGSFIKVKDKDHAVELYREYLSKYPLREEEINKFKKYDYIACWCKLTEKCHGDVLIEILKQKQ